LTAHPILGVIRVGLLSAVITSRHVSCRRQYALLRTPKRGPKGPKVAKRGSFWPIEHKTASLPSRCSLKRLKIVDFGHFGHFPRIAV